MSERPFPIQRGVVSPTTNPELPKVPDYKRFAEKIGVGLYTSLGTTAVELVLRSEIETFQLQFPEFYKLDFFRTLCKFKVGRHKELGTIKDVDIVDVRLYEVKNGELWVGGELSERSVDDMEGERALMAEVIRDTVGFDVELPDEIQEYLKIGRIDSGAENIEPLLVRVAETLPEKLYLRGVYAK